ncbi:MAG: hypothetical protein ABIB71_03840 [Candidatus Woesearchaeota archaeon]
MRDEEWLQNRMEQIWQLLFPDVDRLNNVVIRFKGKWKNKFGHIKKIKGSSEIAINSLFKDEVIPEYIIDLTIAHELVHYWHGFNSPHEKKYRHPHAGGIVTRELKKRGFGHLMRLERDFVRRQWRPVYSLLKGERLKNPV